MKKIITSNVLDPLQLQPFTAQSLRFLQESKEDDVAALIKALVISNLGSYSLTTPYVISGCVYDNTSLYGVTAGEIFYGGKYYQTTALANNTSTNIPRFVLTPSQDATADPLTFSNSSVFNVHTIYKYVATDSATLGDFNATQLVSLIIGKIKQNIDLAIQSTSSTSYADIIGLTYTTPNDGLTRNFLFLFKSHAQATASGGEGIGYELYDSTNAISLDTNEAFIDVAVQTDEFKIPATLQYVGSIAPNTTIKIRFKLIAGASCNSKLNRFTIVEI